MLRPEIAISGLLAMNSCASQPKPSAHKSSVSSGLRSNHSPGRRSADSAEAGLASVRSTPRSCAVTACFASGADHSAMATDTTINTSAMATDCHRKMVWLNGITPVMSRMLLGRLLALACNCAADELSPSAQVAPMPR
ncbi:hypothetical protein D9M72_377690 [compost metagenome]